MNRISKSIWIISAFVIFTSLSTGGSSAAQEQLDRFSTYDRLFVNHAAIDPETGDLLLVSNSWRSVRPTLRRFHPDGSRVSDFDIERFESCCAIHPSLVTVDQEGSIYTLEYSDYLYGFYIYKHAPTGELDIDWGEREGIVESLTPLSDTGYAGGVSGDESDNDRGSVEDYESGESSLYGNAGGGRLNFPFTDPVDIVARADGSLLVLDRYQRYVFQVAPDGRSITEFIGAQGYYPIRPHRLLTDSKGYLYLVDYYDEYDINRSGMIGVFRFTPDGDWQFGWGEGLDTINDPWRTMMDIATLTIDGNDNLVVLGGEGDMNHYEVFIFNTETGSQIARDIMQYRMGYDENFLGMIGNPDGGFIVIDGYDFEILVNYYTTNGTRESVTRIDDLYSID